MNDTAADHLGRSPRLRRPGPRGAGRPDRGGARGARRRARGRPRRAGGRARPATGRPTTSATRRPTPPSCARPPGWRPRGRRRGRRPVAGAVRVRPGRRPHPAGTRWSPPGGPRQVWDFVVTLRPLWWFFRAWLAVQLLDLLGDGHDLATPVPTLRGVAPGVLLLVVATVVSVQIGRGRWWPGSRTDRSVGARGLLLGLNGFALLVAPVILGQFPGSGAYAYADLAGDAGVPAAGIQTRGGYVTNVFPYDAQGRPLTGVQLFDQAGRPLAVADVRRRGVRRRRRRRPGATRLPLVQRRPAALQRLPAGPAHPAPPARAGTARGRRRTRRGCRPPRWPSYPR